jgi:hypothetical protein
VRKVGKDAAQRLSSSRQLSSSSLQQQQQHRQSSAASQQDNFDQISLGKTQKCETTHEIYVKCKHLYLYNLTHTDPVIDTCTSMALI